MELQRIKSVSPDAENPFSPVLSQGSRCRLLVWPFPFAVAAGGAIKPRLPASGRRMGTVAGG